MSYRMIHAARRLMCDKFSILCTIAELNAKQEREEIDYALEAKQRREAYEHAKLCIEANFKRIDARFAKIKTRKEDDEMRIRIKKVRDDIPTPGYAYKGDAGYDLICAEDTIIEPGHTVKIPTGLAFEIAEGYELQIRPRSGVTSKTKLRVQLGTVDSNYRGEVSVIVDNISPENSGYTKPYIYGIDGEVVKSLEGSQKTLFTYHIRKGDRIAQGVIAPVVQAQFKVVDELSDTERNGNGFGSSGTITWIDGEDE